MTSIGKILICAGFFLVAAGIIFYLFGDKLTWLGKLPGDVRIERENYHFYFPITTMILVSIFLTILLWLARRFF